MTDGASNMLKAFSSAGFDKESDNENSTDDDSGDNDSEHKIELDENRNLLFYDDLSNVCEHTCFLFRSFSSTCYKRWLQTNWKYQWSKVSTIVSFTRKSTIADLSQIGVYEFATPYDQWLPKQQ